MSAGRGELTAINTRPGQPGELSQIPNNQIVELNHNSRFKAIGVPRERRPEWRPSLRLGPRPIRHSTSSQAPVE